MSFACQKNCYAKDFTTRVLSCKPAKLDGKDCYEVTLEDTVLFPEGGGQPDDRGTIDGVEVLRIVRKGSIAVHYTAQPVEEGKEVAQVVDWERRFDHMQQHSGQHLITAIADSMYGYKTTSWNLAIGKESKCFIELNTKSVSAEQMKAIEDSCNRKIQEQTVVNVRWLEAGDPELQEVRSRGLPDDHEGSVRVVEMVGIDTNMCCGTHVRNLTDIQAVKLLHVENKKGSTLLFYVAGERVFRMLGKCYSSEKTLTKLLSVGPEEHISAVKKLQEDSRSSAKKSRNLLRDLANLMSALHLQSEPPKPLAIFHR
jgi:misacylated tRNA(Ala) deacylase